MTPAALFTVYTVAARNARRDDTARDDAEEALVRMALDKSAGAFRRAAAATINNLMSTEAAR